MSSQVKTVDRRDRWPDLGFFRVRRAPDFRRGQRGWVRRAAGLVSPILVVVLLTLPSSTSGRSPSLQGKLTITSPHIPGWTNITGLWAPDDIAPPRAHTAVTPEPPLRSDVRFGGTTASGSLTNDSWIYIASEGDWKSLTRLMRPNAAAPPPLQDSAMSFDPIQGYLVLFGGQLGNGTSYGGTWILQGPDWRNYTWSAVTLSPGASPPATNRPLLAWDPSLGANLLVDPSHGGSTWVFHAGAWTNLSALPPSTANGTARMTWDTLDGSVVLVGASPSNGGSSILTGTASTLLSTWRFSGASWSLWNVPTNPPTGEIAGLVWDDARSTAILVITGPTHQIWSFVGGSWQNLSGTQGQPPPIISGGALVYDAWGAFVLLWGGITASGGPTAEMWGWDAPPLGQLGNSTPAAPSFPPILLATAAAIGGIPLAIAAYLYLRPRRPKPSIADSPKPSPAAG